MRRLGDVYIYVFVFLECRILLCFLSVCVSVAMGVGGCVLVCFLRPETKGRERERCVAELLSVCLCLRLLRCFL